MVEENRQKIRKASESLPAAGDGSEYKIRPNRTFPDKSDTKHKTGKKYGESGDAPSPSFVLDTRGLRSADEASTVPQEKLDQYAFGGEKVRESGVKTRVGKARVARKRRRVEESVKAAARSELLQDPDSAGFLQPDAGEFTHLVSQSQLRAAVDITSAAKAFSLTLEHTGPFRINYSRNGRHLLLGGRRGHLANLDWVTKGLSHETSVAETVRDVQFLHMETMYAVAQKKWTYVYDSQGTELHCLRHLFDVRTLAFLPYHFLLVAGSGTSYLHWTDVSIGKAVASFPTREGPLDVLCHNPANAIVHCGHPKGTVSLWSPNQKEPVVKILAHGGAVRGICVEPTGTLMGTSGLDGQVRVWDLRTWKPLSSWKLPSAGLGPVSFSAKKLLAVANGTAVQVFKDVGSARPSLYVQHDLFSTVTDVEFAPFEDVLGVGHQSGFASLLVPGAGEAGLDALEANPYQTKSQRKEWEVKALLDKIQPEMINMDTSLLTELDRDGLTASLDARAAFSYLKPPDVSYQPKYKMKGKSKAGNIERRKAEVREAKRRGEIEKEKVTRAQLFGAGQKDDKPTSLLDRFRTKS